MRICIPKPQLKQLVKGLREIGGNNPIDSLSEMGSKERRAFFEQYTDPEVAKELNAGFERADLKGTEEAVLDWAKKNLKPQDASEMKELAKKRPNEFEKLIKSDKLYEDLINKQIGADLSTDELKEFQRLGKEVYDLSENAGDIGNLIDDNAIKSTEKYLKAVDDMKKYAESISPSANVMKRYALSWKAGVLLTAKSMSLNILGNVQVGASERLIDRIVNKTLGTSLSKEKGKYIKNAIKIYNRTNFDLTRSTGLTAKDSVIGTSRFLGEEVISPKSAFFKKLAEITFTKGLGIPDVTFGAINRSDSLGIMADALSRKFKGEVEGFEGLKGDELKRALFVDGSLLEPKTEAGKIIQAISIHNARVGTWTDDGTLAMAGMKLKNLLNGEGGVLGEFLMPFVKGLIQTL
jgi:hypothetical protein